MFMYLEIIFSTKTQFKSFHYIPNSMHSLKNSPFCDILGAKIINKVKQHYSVGTVSKGAQWSKKVADRVDGEFYVNLSSVHSIMKS